MTREEAIKEAYGIPVNKKQHEALQILIPELKESKSEYERIRKAIVRLIEDLQQSDKNFDGVELTDMLAWLENHNPSFKQISDGIKWDSGLRTGIELGKKEASKAIEYLPKEKVYHIVNELINLSLSGIIPIESEGYTKIVEIKSNVLKLLDYPIEQKSAEWNEEDKKMLNLTIEWAEIMSDQFSFADVDPKDFRKIIAWLKSLKDRGNFPKSNTNSPSEWSEEDRDRVAQYLHDRDGGMLWSKATEITSDILDILHPQSKDEIYKEKNEDVEKLCSNEWSEEDENKLNHILEIVHIAPGREVSVDEKEELESFLKSLRPVSKESLQPHWKPSENQMVALSETIEFAPDTFKPKCTLVTLQDDLKKLMEE